MRLHDQARGRQQCSWQAEHEVGAGGAKQAALPQLFDVDCQHRRMPAMMMC